MRHLTAFRAHDSGRDGGPQVIRASDGDDPLSEPELVRIAERHHRQAGGVDLDDRHISGRIGADDRGRIGLVVVECHFDFRCSVDDVVVGDYIAVLTDDHAGTAALLLSGLGLSFVPEEKSEERILNICLLGLHRDLDIYDRIHRGFRRISEVRIPGL